ncbi:MAG: CBS domain-containing protein [Deltaproteobacteria bacterium]|nr:CBS domain-containing protein [Deltaproteobacteria bacterium]
MFINKSMTVNVIKITEDKTLAQAREKMGKHGGIRHLPVVDDQNTLIGIITDRDIRSALPSSLDVCATDIHAASEKLKVKNAMTKKTVVITSEGTIQDALLLTQKHKVGALPVVDSGNKLIGIISVRDLLRAFINVLGIKEPGTLLCIIVDDKFGIMKKITDAIYEENISTGSILVARYWEKNKKAVFPYLLTQNVTGIKRRFQKLGFQLLDPMDWGIETEEK